MNDRLNREKSLEILIERLIMMVGKSNERAEHLHRRVLHLERLLLDDPPKEIREKKSFVS